MGPALGGGSEDMRNLFLLLRILLYLSGGKYSIFSFSKKSSPLRKIIEEKVTCDRPRAGFFYRDSLFEYVPTADDRPPHPKCLPKRTATLHVDDRVVDLPLNG